MPFKNWGVRPVDEKLKNVPQADTTPSQKATGGSSVVGKAPARPPKATQPAGAVPPPPPPKTARPPKAKVDNAAATETKAGKMPPKAPIRSSGEAAKEELPKKAPASKAPKALAAKDKSNETNLYEQKEGIVPSDEEAEIARLQCEDDDNSAANVGEDDVIEKSYKSGLSDQDRQRKKRKLRRLLLLLLLLLFFAGTVSATYFIIKNITEYVPEFYDNVAIDITKVEFAYDYQNVYPGSELHFMQPLAVTVNADTEEIKYDIVALGIKVTARLTDTGEDCSDIIDVHFHDYSQIYIHMYVST